MVAVQHATKLIYVIEDDPAAALLIREAIELEGDPSWRVRIIPDGAVALATIEAMPPDLILLDLRLPGTDGGTIFRHLRSNACTATLPVLFISGATSYELHDSGIDEGVLLRKPVNPSILLEVLHTHLRAA